MLIPNHLPMLGSGPSSLHPQVFRIHKPVIKDKYRSVVPTVSNLLVNFGKQKPSIEIIDYGVLNAHLMEAHTRTHEIPERPTGLDTFIKTNSEYGSRYSTCSCIRSHRTEDIHVREDEDGIRSHFCPLSRELDGPRDENEDYPDQPMKMEFDVDLIFKGCNLKSEEIPCLVAEKPTLSECEDVNTILGSDVDATTSMIYGLSQNRHAIEDSVTLDYLYKNKTKYFPTQRKLYEKTMSSWIEESSDDTENYISDRDTEAAFKTEDESEMEEFEDMPVKENDPEISRYHPDQEDGETYKGVSEQDENPNTILTNKTENTVDYMNMIGIQNTDFEKGLRKISLGLKNSNVKKLHRDAFTLESGSSESPAETEASEIGLSEDSRFNKIDDLPSSNTEVSNDVIDSSKTGENEPERKTESKVQKSQEFDVRKGDKQDNFAMEPVDMHSGAVPRKGETQPDLATALRFMTEIYPTKDEEDLYSDTLSTTDLPSEVPNAEKSADSDIYQDIPLEQTAGRLVNATSPSKSGPFETVLVENKETGKRSRNKFSKFFQSFKRRLAKKE